MTAEEPRPLTIGSPDVKFHHTVNSPSDAPMAPEHTPRFAGEKLYVKLLVRTQCIVISFHEQVDDEEEDS